MIIYFLFNGKEKKNMTDTEFDYTLEIDFGALSNEDLHGILNLLFKCSAECHRDIELLADEVIVRLDVVNCEIREGHNRKLNHLIIATFNTLKKIVPYRPSTGTKIQIIHDKYNRYMADDSSPVVSPVTSPKVDEFVAPKIMKKVKKVYDKTPKPEEKESRGIKLPKIVTKNRR